MKFTNIALTGAAIGLANARPVSKRAITDAEVLNYALTLEHLQSTFYEQGLKNYTQEDFVKAGMKDPFYAYIKEIASDEKQHEEFLETALKAAGASPVARCTYDFPTDDINSFMAVANLLEGVGLSAYLGAAASIMNETYLTAASAITTTEARHSAYLRAALGQVPWAQAMDNPLTFNQIYTIATPWIVSCPESNGELPVKAFPALTPSSSDPVMTGDKVELMVGNEVDTSAEDVSAAFITATGPVWAEVESKGEGKFWVTVPKGVAGQSYVVMTKGNDKVSDDNTLAGPAIVEIGKVGKKGTPSGMAAMGMGAKATASKTMSGAWNSASATASPSASPTFTGAANKMAGSIAGVVGAGIVAAAALI